MTALINNDLEEPKPDSVYFTFCTRITCFLRLHCRRMDTAQKYVVNKCSKSHTGGLVLLQIKRDAVYDNK